MGPIEPYEMTEIGHQYEEVSKYQRKGVVSLEEGGGEYESVATPTDPVFKEYEEITIKTPTKSPGPPASQTSPATMRTEATDSQTNIVFSECIAYKSKKQAPPTDGDPLYSN